MPITRRTAVDPTRRDQWVHTTAARAVPARLLRTLIPIKPGEQWREGDLVLVAVTEPGQMDSVEHVRGREPFFTPVKLFPGTKVLAVLGQRAGKSTCVAKVPKKTRRTLHLHAKGGLVGRVVRGSANTHLHPLPPTTVEVIARVGDDAGRPLNTKDFGLRASAHAPPKKQRRPKLFLVLGSDMDDGKTNAAKAVIYSLRATGTRVVAGKATGVGRLQDISLMKQAGADVVADFVDFGIPTTVGCSSDEVRAVFFRLYNYLRKRARLNDVIVIELADGILQRETNFLLRCSSISDLVDGVVFACSGLLDAQKGVELLEDWGYNVLAVSGRIGNSPLARRQFGRLTGRRFPVFNSMKVGQQPREIADLFAA